MFDEKNLLLFNLFVKNQSQKDLILYLMNIDFAYKIKDKYPELYLKKFELNDLIELNFNFISGIKIKKKYLNQLQKFSNEEFEIYEKKYNNIILKSNNSFIKEPYSYFFNNQNNLSEIIKNKNKLEYFLHVQLHLIYYILFFEYHNFSQYTKIKKPKIFEKFTLINNKMANYTIQSKKLLNITISFFKKNFKKNPNLISTLNESSFEILLHLIILNYCYTKKLSFNLILKDRYKKIRTFQTLIMFNSLYKNYEEYSFSISQILSYFVTKNYDNILILIKVLDISNLGIDKCRVVMTKMFSNDIIKNNVTFNKVIYNFIQAILIINNKKNEVLKSFLTEILSGIITSNDDEDYYIYIFKLFFGKFLGKFLYQINIEKCYFEYKNKIKESNDENNNTIFFSERFCNYIYYINTYYPVYIQKIFPKIIFVYHNSFNCLFSILNLLNSKSSFYYENIQNEKIFKWRKTIISYLLMNFNYIDNETLINKIFNYYTKPKIKIMNQNSIFTIIYDIEYDEENTKIKIKYSPIKNLINYLEYLSSNEYKIALINSIKIIFKNFYPFNSINLLSLLLQKLLPQEEENEEENIFYLNENYILNNEDEEEINKNIEIINNNISEYKETMIQIIFEKFGKLKDEDLNNLDNPNKILYNILYAFFKTENIKMIDSCLNCISFLYMSKKESFELENIFNYLNLLNKISEKYKNEEKLMINLNELKSNLLEAEKEQKKINKIDDNNNILENKIIKLVEEILIQKKQYKKNYSLKKLIGIFNISNNSNKSLNISMKCIDELIKFLKNELINSINDLFYSSLIIKLFVNIFLSIKSNEFLRNYYLKVFNELLENFLKNNLEINIQISSKLFEVLVKIIKKLKGKTFLIALNILKILFNVFEKYKNNLNSLCIASSISICAYLIEYSHNEISNYISTIILTGINYLKSLSSSIEEKRASAFLLYKVLSKLNDEELKDFSKRIFDAVKISYENSNDKVLMFHLIKCLDFYE